MSPDEIEKQIQKQERTAMLHCALLALAWTLFLFIPLLVHAQIAPSTGKTTQPDNTLFTPNVTNLTAIGGTYNDAASAATSGRAGALRMTANRGLHVNLRDALGLEINHDAGASGAQTLRTAANIYGVVAKTAPSAGSDGTVKQVAVGQYGVLGVIDQETLLAYWGFTFFASTDYLSTGSTSESNLALFRNPNGSGVNCLVQKLAWSSGPSGNQRWRVYRGPTVTGNGTGVTSAGGRTTGQATAQCILSTLPTTSARGTPFVGRYADNTGNTFSENVGGAVIVEPNTAILITTQQSLSGQAGNIDLKWSEVPQ